MMDAPALHQTLEALHAYGESSSVPVANIGRVLVQLAHLDGPLKLVSPPAPADLQTFSQHLLALSNQLSTLHDSKTLGSHMNSAFFRRSKYELFVLQHMQLLVWLQRVQTALIQGVNSARQGQELTQYMLQLSHAARTMVFQPALLHALQVVQFVTQLPKEEVSGSMRAAMQYPAETANDSDRVEWLQLNLLLQFQSIYKDALCNPQIYQVQYTPGEANLFAGFLRLEEIYTHLIGRFPQCCPLSDQEQAVLTQLCQKLNKFFTDGKQIKALLETQGANGKVMLVRQIQNATTPQYAVRDWILPFMIQFTDLLKIMWQLWSSLKRKQQASERVRRSIEGIARVSGRCIVQQIAEQVSVLTAQQPLAMPMADAAPEPLPGSRLGGGGMSRFFELEDDPPQLPSIHAGSLGTGIVGVAPQSQPNSQPQQQLPGAAIQSSTLPSATADFPVPAAPDWATAPPSDFPSAAIVPPSQQPQQPSMPDFGQQLAEELSSAPPQQQPPPSIAAALQQQPPPQAPVAAPPTSQSEALVNEVLNGTLSFGGLDAPSEPAEPSGWASVVRRPASDAAPPATAPPTSGATPPSPSVKRLANAPAPSGADVPGSDEQLRFLVAKREQARAARDFESADKLREQLARLGVTLDDQNKTWRAADGRSGPITQVNISELHAQKAAKSGAASLPDEEIDRLVKEREQARFTSDYKTADRLRDTLEKHGVHLDTKENKWQSIDGRSGPIGPVNISAAHAQKAARQGAPKMPIEEIERILVQREQARARRDYKTADVLRDTLEKHGVYLDPKENKWHSTDGRSGNSASPSV